MVYNQQDADELLSLAIFTLAVRALADGFSEAEGNICHLFCDKLNIKVLKCVVTAFL